MEALRSSETSVFTIVTRRYIPEDGILHVILLLTPINISRQFIFYQAEDRNIKNCQVANCFVWERNMLSYFRTAIILDVIQCPVSYVKHNVLETALSPSSSRTKFCPIRAA
jgi:hypothetical protein